MLTPTSGERRSTTEARGSLQSVQDGQRVGAENRDRPQTMAFTASEPTSPSPSTARAAGSPAVAFRLAYLILGHGVGKVVR